MLNLIPHRLHHSTTWHLCRRSLSLTTLRPIHTRTVFKSKPTLATIIPRFSNLKTRNYATESTQNPSDTDPIPPERWIEALETVANAEWLTHRPLDPSDRMRRAYALLMQVILYLHRPQPEVEQYLVDFMQAEVTPESEIHRARKATTSITRVVLQDLASVPSNPLHADHPQVFAILGALMPLHDVYLDGLKEKEGIILDLPEWTEFWEKAQPILLELALKLDEAGFGLDKQEWEKDQ